MHELVVIQEEKLVTLRAVFVDYCSSRPIKPKTISNYRGRLHSHLQDWLDLDIRQITKAMIEERFRQIGSPIAANATMRTLRALLNYAQQKYEADNGIPYLRNNVVRRLSEIKAWNKEIRRTDCIEASQLRPWLNAVSSLKSATTRDLLLLLLFTGARLSEMRSLEWKDVDLDIGIIYLDDSKNGESRKIPLSSFAWRLLSVRQRNSIGPFVFPSPASSNALLSFNQSNAIQSIIEGSGVYFRFHTLRRVYLTIGDELNIRTELLAELVGHKLSSITENYTIRSIEKLRRASQEICDRILFHAGLTFESSPTPVKAEVIE